MLLKRVNQRGQITIFVIVAIVIVLIAALFIIFRGSFVPTVGISKNIQPVYNSFLSCVQDDALTGINVLESKGGRITEPDFEPGSNYMPFSNMLNFLGNPIPYWYYVSGNNIQKQNVPTKAEMEKDLASFIEGKIKKCRLDQYYPQGFSVYMGDPKAKVTINQKDVTVDLTMPLSIDFSNETAVINTHQVSVNSELGGLYDSAKTIYDYEQSNLFLENYAIDVLRLYAPVDGVLLSCAPKTWNIEQIFSQLKQSIEGNTYAIRSKDGDYSLVKAENKYFVKDFNVPYEVRFLNSPNWSSSYEVSQSSGSLLIATPVGNQPGLGIIGFCYIPYHFVYNIKYPVLVQVSKGDEIFQFPMAVVIAGNKARYSLNTTSMGDYTNQLCQYENTNMTVFTYDNQANPIQADISFECMRASCSIGKTSLTSGLTKEFPQCGNGIIRARAENYLDATKTVSTIDSGTAELILNKLYELNISLMLSGVNYTGDAIISFNSPDYSTTVSYPQTTKIKLTEGQYNIHVYIYRNSSLTIPATNKQQCVDSPVSGLSGLFGLTEKKCFDISMPEQIVSNALSGGGQQNYYILDSELAGSKEVEIDATSLPIPATLDQLQQNYILFEDNRMDINFK